MTAPLVVGIGGTLRSGSSSQAALEIALGAAGSAGAKTELVGAAQLGALPMYEPGVALNDAGQRLVALLRAADGVVVCSPGYHGSVSGLVKNALDYCEELRDDERPYLTGRAVGCIATAYGWQAAVTTVQTLRTIVHALRGWPTPLGVAVNSAECRFVDGTPIDGKVAGQLDILGREVCRLVPQPS